MNQAVAPHNTTPLRLSRHPRRSDHPAIVNSNGEVLATFGMNETRKQIAAAIAASGWVLKRDNTVVPATDARPLGLDQPITTPADALAVVVRAYAAAGHLESAVLGPRDNSIQAERLTKALARLAVYLAKTNGVETGDGLYADGLQYDAEGPVICEPDETAEPLRPLRDMQARIYEALYEIKTVMSEASLNPTGSDLAQVCGFLKGASVDLRSALDDFDEACRQLHKASRTKARPTNAAIVDAGAKI